MALVHGQHESLVHLVLCLIEVVFYHAIVKVCLLLKRSVAATGVVHTELRLQIAESPRIIYPRGDFSDVDLTFLIVDLILIRGVALILL